MKKYIVIGCVALAGCGLMPTKFDNVEYYTLVQLNQFAEITKRNCAQDNFAQFAVAMQTQTNLVDSYVRNTNSDREVKQAMDVISRQVDELVGAYNKPQQPHEAYCNAKMDIISSELNIVVKTVGSKK